MVIVFTSTRDQPGPSALLISAISVIRPYGTRDDLEMKRFLEFTLEMEMFRAISSLKSMQGGGSKQTCRVVKALVLNVQDS